jgi:DNA-binding NarL/FixJ family response regulator
VPATEETRLDEGRHATPGAPPITVVVADDHDLVRSGLAMIIDAQPGLEVVGQAGNGVDALDLVRTQRPDVLLLDVQMPGMDGISATIELTRQRLPTAVLVLTTFDLDAYAYAALRAGASGFLLKTTPPQQLIEAIRAVAAGESLLAPSVTRRLVERFVQLPAPRTDEPPAALASLTDRELGVLGLVARGLSNAEIAAVLHVGESTVKSHLNRLLSKLRLHNRVQAVILAYEVGLLSPGDGERP